MLDITKMLFFFPLSVIEKAEVVDQFKKITHRDERFASGYNKDKSN